MVVVVFIAVAFLLYLAPIRLWRRPCYLDRLLHRRARVTPRDILLPSARILRRNATRLLLGSNLAQLHRPWRLPPVGLQILRSLSRPRRAAADRNHNLFCPTVFAPATSAIPLPAWSLCSSSGWGWLNHTLLARIPARSSVPVPPDLRLGRHRRSHGTPSRLLVTACVWGSPPSGGSLSSSWSILALAQVPRG